MTRGIAAILLAACLSGCSTTRPVEVSQPAPREEPINSLALEQCVRLNDPQQCGAEAR